VRNIAENSLTMPTSSIVRLTEPQIQPAGQLLARAFFDDPFGTHIFPDHVQRQDGLTWYFTALTRASYWFDAVYVTADEVTGVAVWIAPDQTLTPQQIDEAGLNRTRTFFGTEAYERYHQIVDPLAVLHARDVPLPHWYLTLIGVEPDQQGRGLGGALLAPILAQAEATGLACYLETLTPQNVKFYERHGFHVVVEGVLPDCHLPFWTMRCDPKRE